MSDRFQILSIDGGGVKGLFAAAVLAYIEDDLGTYIIKHFDLIVGTSTGGIIAIGLGLGMRPREIAEFYVSKSPEIFPSKFFCRWHKTAYQLRKRKYSNGPLRGVLQAYYGRKRLGDSKKRLVIPSYNLSDDDVYLFKTAHHERFRRDYKVPAWKVGLATSAAPTFFPCFKGIDSLRLIDGGIWANNPTMIGLTEAIGVLKIDPQKISILSLGTSDEVVDRPKSLDDGGLWRWKKQAVEVVMRGQSLGAINQTKLILGENKILRVDPKVPEGLFELDKVSTEDHIAKAAHQSRIFMPEIKKRFMDHEAPAFIPFHKFSQEENLHLRRNINDS
ncbi:patatin-like phospholipase family protein [bacterium]|nr:patatin-like phospholipase family protein [bacterium]